MLLLGCLFALLRLFALPISILIARDLGYLGIESNWDVLRLTILLGLYNLFLRPILGIILEMFSLKFVYTLGLSRASFDFITKYIILFFVNSLGLFISCNLTGVVPKSLWLATLTISLSAYLISTNASASFTAMGPKGPAGGAAKKSDGSDVIDI